MPSDFKKSGVLVDDDLNDMLVLPLPAGVRLTALFDCCHSGTALDLYALLAMPPLHTYRQSKCLNEYDNMMTDHHHHRPFMEVASKDTPAARNVREAAIDARARDISNRKLAASAAKPRGSASSGPAKAAPSPKGSPRGDVMGLVKNMNSLHVRNGSVCARAQLFFSVLMHSRQSVYLWGMRWMVHAYVLLLLMQ